jgi:hypothetical protein
VGRESRSGACGTGYPYFAVTADDASGHVLAESATVLLEK